MIVKYKTLEHSIASRLDEEVEQYLQLGWELYGHQYYDKARYIQVVILKEQPMTEKELQIILDEEEKYIREWRNGLTQKQTDSI
jgi:hypothetical protein